MRRMLAALASLWSTAVFAGVVDAAHYDSYWLWAGVAAQPVLETARSVYVLQGQIEPVRGSEDDVDLIAQGVAATRFPNREVWLVYRARTLRWTPRIFATMLAQRSRWQAAGSTVVGVQIDFDARTRHLGEYLDFLQKLRQQLPANCRLSITGLLDWSSRIGPEHVNRLRGIVDEVIVQTYQGRHTIPQLAAYLPRVGKLQIPFKLGLVQRGVWEEPDYLRNNPWFRGYVVFLLNPTRGAAKLDDRGPGARAAMPGVPLEPPGSGSRHPRGDRISRASSMSRTPAISHAG